MKSKLAITSFVFGVISLLLVVPEFGNLQMPFIISSVVLLSPLIGLITGISSLIVIKKEGAGGIWFATFGIVFSIIGLIALILAIFGLAEFISSWPL